MRLRFLGLAFLCLLFVSPPLEAGTSRDEYEVKAAFLLNFARLVDWPQDLRPKEGASWIVAVVGDDDVIATLSKSLDGANVDEASVAVRRVSKAGDLAGAHILFITRNGADRDAMAEATAGRPVLTVGESRDFATDGGMVNFVNRDNKLRFEINHEVARSAGLKISSRLLRLALRVEGH